LNTEFPPNLNQVTNDRSKPKHVAVIGAGWAGLAAAFELSKQRFQITLIEQAPLLGGRARSAAFKPNSALLGDEELRVDNGQHLLMGAYSETLKLLDQLASEGGKEHGPSAAHSLAKSNKYFDRFPVFLKHSQGFSMQANAWPAPLHLARAWFTAKGLHFKDRVALVYLLANLKMRSWLVREQDISVSQLLESCYQPEHLVSVLWRPLCLSALNTPPDRASAKVFAAVMRDTLGAAQSASDFLVANVSLGEVIPDAIERHLIGSQSNGTHQVQKGFSTNILTKISTTTNPSVASFTKENISPQWQIQGRGKESIVCDAIVLATPWAATCELLDSAGIAAPSSDTVDYLPIVTVYLYWRQPGPKQKQFPLMLADQGHNPQAYGQWLFDLGQTSGGGRLASVVISGPGAHEQIDREILAQSINAQVARETGWILADSAWAITEKRATFACTVGLNRPAAQCSDPSIALCGDVYQSEYPATLETAIRSGLAAAKNCIAHLREQH
jgi:hydroxysqualene dehydroxylase